MRFILEFDGLLADQMPALYAAHREAAGAVGWSRLDEPTFRRLIRTKGPDADVLPGAKQIKLDAYGTKFEAFVEQDAVLGDLTPQASVAEHLRQLRRFGAIVVVSTGRQIGPRRAWLASRAWADQIERFEQLDDDPRRRPVELRVLAEADDRSVMVSASEILVRSADAADLFTVGVSSGACSVKRLHQAGARVVYRELGELSDSLKSGGGDLVRAGMLPIV